jgi:hypothetical protein
MAKKTNGKIGVEIEAAGREFEIEIDPETGDVTIEEDTDSADDDQEEDPSEESGKSGPGLVLGVLVGAAAGAVGAIALVRQLAADPSGGSYALQDASESGSDGLLGQLRSRWRVATLEGRLAAQEAEREKLARYKELTGNDPK